MSLAVSINPLPVVHSSFVMASSGSSSSSVAPLSDARSWSSMSSWHSDDALVLPYDTNQRTCSRNAEGASSTPASPVNEHISAHCSDTETDKSTEDYPWVCTELAGKTPIDLSSKAHIAITGQ